MSTAEVPGYEVDDQPEPIGDDTVNPYEDDTIQDDEADE